VDVEALPEDSGRTGGRGDAIRSGEVAVDPGVAAGRVCYPGWCRRGGSGRRRGKRGSRFEIRAGSWPFAARTAGSYLNRGLGPSC